MKTRRQDQIAKSIRVLVQMGEKYSNECIEYNETEKNILNDFFIVLKIFNKQAHPTLNMVYREEMKKEIDKFLSKYVGTDQHYKFPFLWFACTFFESLKGMLISEKKFFPILLDISRSFTKALKDCISLEDKGSWEELQYDSNSKIFSFLHQLLGNEKILLSGLQDVLDKGLVALNPKRISEKLKYEIERGNHSYKELFNTFFDLARPEWAIRFNLATFNLEEYFYRFKLINGEKFTEILKFTENSILRMSVIHQVAKIREEEYIGRYIIPKNRVTDFNYYLQEKEKENLLKILSVNKILNSNETVSYQYYQIGKGWKFDKVTEFVEKKYFSIGEWETNWSIPKENHIEYIQSFCDWSGNSTYSDLRRIVGELNSRQEQKILFRDQTNRMKNLYKEGVIKLILIPFGLISSYSLKEYVLSIPPKLNERKISKLLSLLPYSYIYYLDDNSTRINTYLDKNLLNLCQKKLGIYCEEITLIKQMNSPYKEMYNPETRCWKINL